MKRTPLARRTPLRSRSVLATTPLTRSRTPRQRRPRDTGPSKATKDELLARSGGRCEVCGRTLTWAFSRHHRRPRQSGGTSRPETNYLSNLLMVCGTATTPDGCHLRIEDERMWAYVQGYLVHQEHDPETSPVVYRGALVYLNTDGTLTPIDTTQEA